MASIREVNLDILLTRHRMSKQAENGYRILHGLILTGREEERAWLLRHHDQKAVGIRESYLRDDIDQLIDSYCWLMIAMLAGRISTRLPPPLEWEIVEILGDTAVQDFYKKHYPLVLPQALLTAVRDPNMRKRVEIVARQVKNPNVFQRFRALDRKIEEDQDIEMFLSFMDDFWVRRQGFPDLVELLNNPEELAACLVAQSGGKEVLGMAARGLLKYVDIMAEYRELLEDAEANPVLASAFWHKQGYWFDAIGHDFHGQLFHLLINLKHAVRRTFVKPVNGLKKATDRERAELKREAVKAANESIENVDFILQRKWYTPLTQLLNGTGPWSMDK
jgi:hypothetical protein